MKKRFSVTITDELYKALTTAASKLDLSPNKYTAMLLAEKLQGFQDSPETDGTSSNIRNTGKRRNYTLDLADAAILKRKASALGLCDTAYLRMLIRTKNFKKIDYTVDDLFEYLTQHQKVINAIQSFVDLVKENGKGIVFEPDIRRLIQLSEEIKAAMLVQINLTVKNRAKVYNEMKSKIEEGM